MLVIVFLLIIAGAVAVDRFLTSGKSVSIKENDVQWRPENWQSAPEIAFKTLDQRTVTLSAYQGKIVILNFWATWCPSCKVEFASLLKLVRLFNGQVVLVAVSADRDPKALEVFLESLRAEFAPELDGKNVVIPWDPERQITGDVFQTERFPEAIIMSRDLRMARKIVGSYDWESADIKDFIRNLLVL